MLFPSLKLRQASAKNNIPKVIRSLSCGANPSNRDFFTGESSLHLACYGGYEEVVQLLLDSNADVNNVDIAQYSPLHIAAMNNFEGTLRILLSRGANVHQVDKNGMTALHWASWYGFKGCVRTLIEFGSEPNLKEKKGGFNCIDLARLNFHKDIVKILNPYDGM